MTFATKFLFSAIGVIGSCCVAATPWLLSSSERKSIAKKSISSENQKVSQELSKTTTENSTQPSFSETNQIDNQLSELWARINEGFKNKQKNHNSETLPWEHELKNILKNDNNGNSNWIVATQEWENCKVGQVEKVDYCGYIELKNGDNAYKSRITYKGKANDENSWEVIVVKKSDGQAKCYNKTTKNWMDPKMQWDKHFAGKNGGVNNGWNNLGCISI